MGLIERIKGVMAEKGFSQYKLANKAEIPHSTMSALMNKGIKHPTVEMISKIADALETTVSFLLEEEDPVIAKLDLEEGVITKRLLETLKLLVNDENKFLDLAREELFKTFGELAMVGYEAQSFFERYTEYLKRKDEVEDDLEGLEGIEGIDYEYSDKDMADMADDYDRYYDYNALKIHILNFCNSEQKHRYLDKLENLLQKYNIKNPFPYVNEKEFEGNAELLDGIKRIAEKHSMDLSDPRTLELMDSALDLIKRMQSK